MFCSSLLIKFADRRSIPAKFDSPCRANGFINHESSSKVIPFCFSRTVVQESIMVIIVVSIFEKESYSYCCYSVWKSLKSLKKKVPGCR